ncbi:Major facilitator superfamily domain, general substrate transporter [Metarhizium rileyi]|uniref:Major facilitator superfamily domain, general substrate transporter n=1 Tax=Metarhizium rileyi (strain RCEF 4871) TaxID=1649241 RepID=A0A167AGW0_METRR|nr:Major facilitator superfamily domain, general substrate transporter [Metarhizium rileyi RCEF 4871]
MAQDDDHDGLGLAVNIANNEQQPLMRTGSLGGDDIPSLPAQPSAPRPLGMVTTCFALNILLEVGLFLITIPLNQVLEEVICQHSVSPRLPRANAARCKSKVVQSELSFIRGWQVTFDIIPGLLTAVPYGIMADRYGRELVLGLSVLGGALASSFSMLVCSLPSVFSPRAVWLSSAFGFVGGGTPVFNAITFAIVGSLVSEKQRSIVFFYIAATVLGSQLIASPLVYLLIRVDTWLPMYCGLACLWLATAVVFSVPRMLVKNHRRVKGREPDKLRVTTARTTRQRLVDIGKAAVWFARGNILVTVLLLTFLVTSLGRLAQEILLQYITKRYGWSWSEAGLLLSVQAFLTLMLLTVILPLASQTLARKTTLATQSRSFWLARVSVLMSALGAFTIGLSERVTLMSVGLGLFALGNGYPPLLRSLLASIVDKRQVNMMYTSMSVFETMGSIVAGPLLAASFRLGMELDGAWIGLPFLVTGCLFGSAAIAVACISVSSVERKASEASEASDIIKVDEFQ